jgi:hypothetical protein
MMKRVTTPTLRLELGFAGRDRTLKLLQTLAQDPRVSVNIMRARITEDYASLELELVGEGARVVEVASILNEAATVKDPGWRPVSRAS